MTKKHLDLFERFLDDEEAVDMFIHGPAGSGKTTLTEKLVKILKARGVKFLVCAHTHKACEVLETKLSGVEILTLDSYLKRIPMINKDAKKVQHVSTNATVGSPHQVDFLVVDEFGTVGEDQHMRLAEMAYDDDGKAKMKILWLGDMNQLKAVGSASSVIPYGDYEIKLTKVHRTSSSSLLDTLSKLVEMVEGKRKLEYLEPHETFVRDQDIVKLYRESKSKSKCLLAYTNWQVQHLNAEVQGYEEPKVLDTVSCTQNRQQYTFLGEVKWAYVDSIFTGFKNIDRTDKYNTLRTLEEQGYKVGLFFDGSEDREIYMAYVFGHGEYKELHKKLSGSATMANNKIPDRNPTEWARANKSDPRAKARAKAWKEFLAFENAVVCMDFPHAFTVHKSQGSTYEEVYLDMQDIAKASDKDTLIRLTYVGVSRASKIVYTN